MRDAAWTSDVIFREDMVIVRAIGMGLVVCKEKGAYNLRTMIYYENTIDKPSLGGLGSVG